MNVTVALGSRANFGSLRSAMLALRRRGAEVRPVLFATALDERYGDVRGSLKRDDFTPFAELSCHLEGHVTDMGKSAGHAAVEWSTLLRRCPTDAVLVVGDRHEVLGAATAAAYANVRLVHTMGGEVSGSIDDKVRDAITALADVHCVATVGAQRRILRLVGASTAEKCDVIRSDGYPVHVTGCPRIDTAREVLTLPDRAYADSLMVSQHPVTTLTDAENFASMQAILQAVERVATDRQLSVELFWPNGDSGTSGTHRAIRAWLNSDASERLQVRTHRAMGPEDYCRMMAATRCLIGNSSSGLREGAWIGTPVVNVGGRQRGREHGENVVDVDPFACINGQGMLRQFISRQCAQGPYPSSSLYGDGTAGERVAAVVMGEAS